MWLWRLILFPLYPLIPTSLILLDISLACAFESMPAGDPLGLWARGQEAYEKQAFGEAIFWWSQLEEKAKNSTHALETQLPLAQALLCDKQASRALPLLKSYLSQKIQGEENARARLLLAEANLALGKIEESALIPVELNHIHESIGLSLAIRAEALSLHSKTQFLLENKKAAEEAIDLAEKLFLTPFFSPSKDLAEKLYTQSLSIKLWKCQQFLNPAQEKQESREEQVRGLLQARASCLLEAFTSTQRVLLLEGKSSCPSTSETRFEQLINELIKAVKSYHKICLNPPPPTPISPARTSEQTLEYNQELSQILLQDWSHFLNQVSQWVLTWKTKVALENQKWMHLLEKELKKV